MKPTSEDGFLGTVIELARLRHWLVYHQRPARTRNGWRTAIQGAPGFPDLVLVRPATGGLLFVELKTERGGLTSEQKTWLEALREVGLPVRVWRPRDWPEIEEALA